MRLFAEMLRATGLFRYLFALGRAVTFGKSSETETESECPGSWGFKGFFEAVALTNIPVAGREAQKTAAYFMFASEAFLWDDGSEPLKC